MRSAAMRVIAVLLVAGCAHLVEVQQLDVLYFGTAKPGGVVSDAEWQKFAEEVIVPRFPGFTEWTAEGHWKESREGTHVVQIIHPPRSRHDRAIEEIIREYKVRFQQESVLLVRSRALALFE